MERTSIQQFVLLGREGLSLVHLVRAMQVSAALTNRLLVVVDLTSVVESVCFHRADWRLIQLRLATAIIVDR